MNLDYALRPSLPLLLFAACGGSSPSQPDTQTLAQRDAQTPPCGTSPHAGDFPFDVASVLQAKCQTCHRRPPVAHAPFPILTYEDALQVDTLPGYTGDPIWQVMAIVIQPNGVPHMPFGNAPQLTPRELDTLSHWLATCAVPVAEGAGGDIGEGPPSSDAGAE